MAASRLQKEIQRQMAESSLADAQIDFHQESVVQLLKQTIVEKHYFVQRLFLAESYSTNKFASAPDILHEKVFTSEQEKKIYDNFAALELPSDFIKGPVKAFLNTLLDSLESFLPAFFQLTPYKLPTVNCCGTPADVLVRCVFPTLFGYCWATEPATAYAENLVRWFGELYQTRTDLVKKFRNEWMFSAMRGFFASLDFEDFVASAVRPVFIDFVQATKEQQKDPERLVSWAVQLLDNIMKYAELFPAVLNELFSLLHNEIQRLGGENADSDYLTIVCILFYDGIIQSFLRFPLLYVADIPIQKKDWKRFRHVYDVFRIKLGDKEGIKETLVSSILSQEMFNTFDPTAITKKIDEHVAKGKLPSLQDFCNIVQCAHQPLLISTHHLALLFRFVASLQHLANLPQAIDRSIALMFQNSLADQLEVLDDEFFWFPCFSLKYMNIKSTSFEKTMAMSPTYRLLAKHDLHLRASEEDFATAILNAENSTNIATQPCIRTEICWLRESVEDLNALVPQLEEEMLKKAEEINRHRERAKKLNIFAMTLQAMINGIPRERPKIELGFALSENFSSMKEKTLIGDGLDQIKQFCGPAFITVGQYITEALIMKFSPDVKLGQRENVIYEDGESGELQRLTRPPLVTSSLIPDAIRLAQDCITVMKYASNSNIGNSIAKCFKAPFMKEPDMFSQNLSNCLSYFNDELLSYVFTKEEHAALISFFAVYICKSA